MLDKTEMSLDDIIKADKVTKNPKKKIQPVRKSAATKGAGSKAARSQQQRPKLKSSAVATSSKKILKGKNRGGIIKPNPNKKNIKVLKKAQIAKQQRNFKTAPRGKVNPKRIPAKNLQTNKRKPAMNPKSNSAVLNARQHNSAITSTGPDNGAKLFISNLEPGVTSDDMRELFEDVGEIKNAFVHYDSRGNSLRTANVNFKRKLDAVKAMKQYNGVALDGKPMVIQMITSDIPDVQPVSVKDRIGATKRPIRRS